jgi:hypothetical protein
MLSNRTISLIVAAASVGALYLLWKQSQGQGPPHVAATAGPPVGK